MCSGGPVPQDCPVDVLGSEAVLLGNDVTCDGFHRDRRIRIQTHAHEDHLKEFATSKAGVVVLTKPTLKLLEYKHRDLPYRPSVHALEYGEVIVLHENRIELYPSNHILGAAQAKVTTPDKLIIGSPAQFVKTDVIAKAFDMDASKIQGLNVLNK